MTGGVLPLGYQAHLVTLQVNVQPNGRNLPYDAFVDVTMFPGSWSDAMNAASDVNRDPQALPPVVMYPLVITDAMESASVGRSLEVIRQAALQLSGIVASAGVNFGLGGGTDRLESILGSDRNSLVTLGRVSDHTVRIRLGAQAQGSSKLALVPRTHNVSLVVFTKASDQAYIERLSVITRASFKDVDTGLTLDEGAGRRERLATEARGVVGAYDFQLDASCEAKGQADGPLDLLRATDRGDYLFIGKCLRENGPGGMTIYDRARANRRAQQALIPTAPDGDSDEEFTELVPTQEAQVKRLLASLMQLQRESRYSKFLVQLTPNKPAQLPPVQQLVVLKDDKKATTTVIRGGKNLDVKKLSAKLHVASKDSGDLVLLPTQVAVDAEGAVSLAFPSLSANQVTLKEFAPPVVPASAAKRQTAQKSQKDQKAAEGESKEPKRLVEPRIELTYAFSASKQANTGKTEQLTTSGMRLFSAAKPPATAPVENPSSASFTSVKYLQDEEKGTSNPVSTSSGLLVADVGGNAKLTLMVGDIKELKAPVTVRVSGADIRGIDPKAEFTPKSRSFAVAGSGIVTMTLGNLSPARAVQIETLANGQAQGSAIVLTVEPARGRPAQ